MIKGIFFDVDGTLRDFNEYGVRPSVYEAIEKARAAGVKCFVATGRHREEIREDYLLGDLKFDGYVYLNGCYCTDGDGNVVFTAPVHPSQAEKALELLEAEPFSLLAMEADRFYVNEASQAIIDMHKTLGSRTPRVNPDMTDCVKNEIYQLVIYGDMDVLDRVAAQLPLCAPTRWNEGGALDLVPVGVDKCTGVTAMMKYFGFAPEEVAAVGDSFNDMGMLKLAGLSVCMGSGRADVKAIADYVAPHIDDDGLLKAVEYILAKGLPDSR
ncbi:MAG: HAD family hydrolase [Clostridiales bacterium]|nr:HAD family hydrolase [Clostridiales bacterium]